MISLFNKHPKDVCLTYFQHWKFSMELSGKLFIGSTKALIHAFIPFIFISSTSDLNRDIEKRLGETGCK